MFGETIDYQILKLLAHGRNRATEEELNRGARRSTFTLDEARAYAEKVRTVYFGGLVPVAPDLSYLDIGCGNGRLSIGLVLAGARDVTGVDIVRRHVEEANKISEQMDERRRPCFHCADIHDWDADRQFDVIFCLGVMEHIHDPADFLNVLGSLMKPSGLVFASHEPFHSPIGDHMTGFFRVQIPWRGLLFSEKVILRLRQEYFRPTDPVRRFQDIAGGLNLMRFGEYLKLADAAGLEFIFHSFNPQLGHHRRYRLLHPISRVLTQIPKVQDFFIVCAYSVAQRRLDRSDSPLAGRRGASRPTLQFGR